MEGWDDQDEIDWEGLRRGIGWIWCLESEYVIIHDDICNGSYIGSVYGYFQRSHGFRAMKT